MTFGSSKGNKEIKQKQKNTNQPFLYPRSWVGASMGTWLHVIVFRISFFFFLFSGRCTFSCFLWFLSSLVLCRCTKRVYTKVREKILSTFILEPARNIRTQRILQSKEYFKKLHAYILLFPWLIDTFKLYMSTPRSYLYWQSI